jgi:hypothetical protein
VKQSEQRDIDGRAAMKKLMEQILSFLVDYAWRTIRIIFSGWAENILALIALCVTLTAHCVGPEGDHRCYSIWRAFGWTAGVWFGWFLLGVIVRWIMVFVAAIFGSLGLDVISRTRKNTPIERLRELGLEK